MQYIHLNDDSFIIQTSQGTHNVSRTSFNFNRLTKLIRKEDVIEKEILDLLVTPDLPDGVFQAYLYKKLDQLVYQHIREVGTGVVSAFFNIKGENFPVDSKTFKSTYTFLGIYASKEEVLLDWPEYVI
jgi:hypothetical protein